MTHRALLLSAIAAALLVGDARAQAQAPDYKLLNGAFRSRKLDDYYEVQAQGGFLFEVQAPRRQPRGPARPRDLRGRARARVLAGPAHALAAVPCAAATTEP